jgi:VCBS repeat-containing protein
MLKRFIGSTGWKLLAAVMIAGLPSLAQAVKFVPAAKLSAGTNPKAVAVADFNLDGIKDLVIANFNANNVSVLLGKAGGGYQPASTFPVGSGPVAVAVGNLNAPTDPYADIAVANRGSNNVSVLLGDGTGGFTPDNGSPYAVGNSPSDVAFGHFNPPDTRLDLVVSNQGSDNIAILYDYNSTGNYFFFSPQYINVSVGNTVATAPAAMAAGDFIGNNGQWDDLAVANQGSNNITVFVSGNFGINTSKFIISTGIGTGPADVAIGDLDRDGFADDLAVANQASNDVSVLLGNGGGIFTPAAGSPFAAGSAPIALAISDFDGINGPDLAVGNKLSHDVSVLMNNGAGGFMPAAGSPFSAGTNPVSLAVASLNAPVDPYADIAVANEGSNDVSILLNDGLGNFATVGENIGGNSPAAVAVGNLNPLVDPYADLVVANENSNDVSIFLNDGFTAFSGGFGPATNYPAHFGPAGVAIGNLNPVTDPYADLAVANRFSNDVSVLLGDGMGGFGAPAHFAAGITPLSVAIGDLNPLIDPYADIAVANFNSNDVSVFLGDGAGGFAAGSIPTGGTGPAAVTLADINMDTYADLIVANSATNDVSVFLNNGAGGFTAAPGSPFAAGTSPVSVAIGDFDGLNGPDLAVANNGSNDVSILLADGAGGYLTAVNYAVGSSPVAVAVGHFNPPPVLGADMFPDLAVANNGTHDVTILMGDGAGGFTPAPGSPFAAAGSGPSSLAVASLNTLFDPYADLAVANYNSGNVSVLLNVPNQPPTLAVNALLTVQENDPPTAITSAMLQVTDPDNTPAELTFTLLAPPANGSLQNYGVPLIGGNTFSQTDIDLGMLQYQPNTGYFGADSFEFDATDGAVAIAPPAPPGPNHVFDITVTPLAKPPAPTASPNPITVPFNDTLGTTSQISPNDPNAGDTHTYAVTTPAVNGTATMNGAQATYTPATGFAGNDSFVVTVTDNTNRSGTVTIDVTVSHPGLTLVNNTGLTLDEGSGDTPITTAMLQVTDPVTSPTVPTLTYTLVTAPGNGTLKKGAIPNGQPLAVNDTFTQADIDNGLITYMPNAGVSGLDSFVFSVDDGVGGTIGNTNFFITINAVNNPPVPTASPNPVITDEDLPGASLVSPNDPDFGDTHTFTIPAPGNPGAPANGTATVNTVGVVTYTPNPNYNGPDSFDVTVTDQLNASGTVTINVTVNPVNDPPAPTAPPIVTDTQTPGTSQISPNDPDAGDTHTYAVTTPPAMGQATVDAAGLATYTPNGFSTGTDSFVVTVTDAIGATGTVTIDVTVNAAPPPPPTCPSLSLGINANGFVTGNPLTLSASVTPCQNPVVADAYVSVSTPGGASIYLQLGGAFAVVPTPMVTNWTVAPFNGNIFHYVFRGGEPVGTYTVNAFLAQPGTMNVITSAPPVNFSFAP